MADEKCKGGGDGGGCLIFFLGFGGLAFLFGWSGKEIGRDKYDDLLRASQKYPEFRQPIVEAMDGGKITNKELWEIESVFNEKDIGGLKKALLTPSPPEG